jgi:NAD(P)-dependent dehydrogenase (short-subunit alcohol dehydrogenase family)
MGTSFEGRVAFVTGGGTGIGAAIATALADAGAKVMLTGRRSDVLEAKAAAIREEGGEARAIVCDVTCVEQLAAAAAGVVDACGRLDIVVANAGAAPRPGPVLQMDPADWRGAIDLNLTGTWNTAHVTAPHLAASGGGHMLVIGSCAGRTRNGETVGAYATAKAGLSVLCQIMAWELAAQGIAVNELTPGLTTTAATGVFDDQVPDQLKDTAQHMGEWLKSPDEVAQLALYILSLPAEGTSGQRFSLERNR